MLCEVCDAEEAAFTIIPTGDGLPQTLGPGCFARAGLELAKQILPPEEIAQTLGPMFVTPARAETLAKGRKSKSQPEPEPEPETTPEPGPTAGEVEVQATGTDDRD